MCSKLLEIRTQFSWLWKILYNITFAFLIKNNRTQEAICNWYLFGKSIFSTRVSLTVSTIIQGSSYAQEKLANTKQVPWFFACMFLCFVLFCLSYWFTFPFFSLLWFSFVIFFVVYIFLGILWERERIWSWVGRDMGKTWEELGQEKNIIKINCMKNIFTWPTMKEVIFYALSADLSLTVSSFECMIWV